MKVPTAQLRILRKLDALGGNCRARDLIDEDIPRGTVYHTLARMVHKGFLCRSQEEEKPPRYGILFDGLKALTDLDRQDDPKVHLDRQCARLLIARKFSEDARRSTAACELNIEKLKQEMERDWTRRILTNC